MTKPSKEFWRNAEWLTQYVHHAQKRLPALAYYGARKEAPLSPMLCSMADSSWRTTINNRSMMSHLIFLGWKDRWSLLTYSGSLSKTTTLSTGEAESYTLCKSITALLGFSNNIRQEGIQTMNIPSGDNKCSLINSVTGNRRGMAHMPHYVSQPYDCFKEKLIEEPQYNLTGGNWSDLGTKCLRDGNDFEHKLGGVTVSRNSKEWLQEWEERSPEDCNIEITMDHIHGLLEKYGFEETPELKLRKQERERKRRLRRESVDEFSK